MAGVLATAAPRRLPFVLDLLGVAGRGALQTLA